MIGYDLKNVLNEVEDCFDIMWVLCGVEGLLVFIIEVKFNLMFIFKVCMLVNVKYDSFDFVLCNVFLMVEVKVLLVEIVDLKVFNFVKEDIIWYSVKDLLIDVFGKEM